MIRRIERDIAIDAVLLSIYWHRPADASATRPLKDLCRDSVLCAKTVGNGLNLDIERFNHKVDEEKKRAVMGQSAWRAALDMLGTVKKAEPQRTWRSHSDLLANILVGRPEIGKGMDIIHMWQVFGSSGQTH